MQWCSDQNFWEDIICLSKDLWQKDHCISCQVISNEEALTEGEASIEQDLNLPHLCFCIWIWWTSELFYLPLPTWVGVLFLMSKAQCSFCSFLGATRAAPSHSKKCSCQVTCSGSHGSSLCRTNQKNQMAKAAHRLVAAILRMSCVGLTLGKDSKNDASYVI